MSATCFGLGDLRATATLLDITKEKKKPRKATTIASGLTLRVTMTDRSGHGEDSIGITLWHGDTLLLASRWDSSETLEQALAHGQVHVR